ncbi:MAG: hypothetical protein M3O20_12535 [Acidobacteriota bacterium]|nr:hypothetical protein [Acidobacteriota bacterium]
MRLDIMLKVPRPRFVVVHYHFFKNGGSTIESILEREFGGEFATLHGPTPDTELDNDELSLFLSAHRDIKAVSSHHLRYPLPNIKNVVIFDLCFIRHPLDRLQSMYSYLRKSNTDGALGQMANTHSVAGFLRKLLDEAPHLVSNVQVLQLARSGRFTRPAGEADLARAIEAVRKMAIPGVVELFDASLVAAEYFLRPAFPLINLHYTRQNVTAERMESAHREKRYREWWGTAAYEDACALNQFDLQLHAAAVAEVHARLALVPQAQERMNDFRSRCAKLVNLGEGLHLVPLERSVSLRRAAGQKFTD